MENFKQLTEQKGLVAATESAEEKYLQALPSLQQDLEDPEDQVYQTGQLDQLHQPDLFHQENPESV